MESVLNRYYDPSTDQFISVDPMVQETDQPYAYANDNPLNFVDPLGLCIRAPDHGCVKTAPTRQSPPKASSTPKTGAVIGSSPYFGAPTVKTSSSALIPAGVLDISISASASFQGQDSSSAVSIDSDGTVDLSAGGASATISPNGAIDELGISGLNSVSYSQTQDLGLDRVTTTVSATFEPSPSDPWGFYSAGGVVILWLLRPIVATCARSLTICVSFSTGGA